MEEKDSEISGPCEEFRIYFCGGVPSGSVAWYCIDVLEKTESSTKELNPFSVTKHFPSVYHAFLNGCIYSLGGQQSDRTLLNDVWILDIKSLDSFAARVEEKLKDPEKPQKRLKLKEPEFEKPKDPEKPQEPERSFSYWKPKEPKPEEPEKPKDPEKPQKWLKLKEPEFEKPKESERSFSYWKPEEPEKPQVPKVPLIDFSLSYSLPVVDLDDSDFFSFLGPFEPASPKEPEKQESKSLAAERLLWARGPPMTFARCNPHTMVVDQKLYVLGGFEPNQNHAYGWIEVFDPVVGRWEFLPSPPDEIHSSVMISGLLKAKKEIIIAKQRWDRDPMTFYSYNIMTRCWNTLVPHRSEASVHLPPNAGRAVTVGNTLYWISTEEHNTECIICAYDLDRNMWFEEDLNTAAIFGSLLERREHFSSIYSSRPGFLHLRDQKFCLLLQSSITKDDPESSIEYLYRVILDIYKHEDRGKIEWTTVSVRKYSIDQYINFLDCMLE